ncbi:DUF402 domain-containing protein [Lachnoclostridium sp. Marseille-P6806]|uniref:DUF402 domain-containing protein n=1 Tax=Lachnoclostridium sp. Marseille-P6806 TaxID=2364793 RepID=UPI001031AE08|nr:DUF402 domain-containing protein [Lachnoclostridium sp. Marseille-P6806]
MNRTTALFRRRLIPEECIRLDSDVIERCDEAMLVTSWRAIRPKRELSHGYSVYYLKRGIKVSQFIAHDGSLMYWYCDIVDYDYRPEENTLIVTDLLADVLLYPDGRLKVVDLDELAQAFDEQKISAETMVRCLRRLNSLLEIIYSRQFEALQRPILELQKQSAVPLPLSQ